MLTGAIHGELPVERFSYTNTLNTPGSASITIALNPSLAHVNANTVVTGAATAVYIERFGRIVWSGLLWDAVADFAAGTLELRCEGWLSYFRLRHYHTTTRFERVDQAVIARSLLQHAGTYGDGSKLGMIRYGTELTGVRRDRTYKQSERKPIGEAVEQLAAVEDGFDFSFDSAWDDADLITTFRVHYPAIGRRRGVTFEQDRNCDVTRATVGGKSVRTFALVVGAGDGPEQLWATANRVSRIHPRLEDISSHTDVKEVSTLRAKAEHAVRVGAAPVVLPTIELYPDAAPGLDAFDLGDQVSVIGGYGLVRLDGAWRVTEISTTVDSNGAESVTLTVAPLEVFHDSEPEPAAVTGSGVPGDQ